MSIPFNDTATYKGLVQLYEREIGFDRGDVSGNADRLKEFVADVNIELDEFFAFALQASGKWHLDDSNHLITTEPQIVSNIVSGTRRYSILSDAQSNLALEIFKVYVLPSATATIYQEVTPFSKKIEDGISSFNDGLNQQGIPNYYNKDGMSIDFDLVPNYNAANGIKILISREGSYFTSADTTKKPGVPGIFHALFYLKPAEAYARIHELSNYSKIVDKINTLEALALKHFGGRAQDQTSRLMGVQQNYE